MSRVYDSTIKDYLCLPSLLDYFCIETGRSNFMEAILKVVDAAGFRLQFENDRVSCMYVRNNPYSPLLIIAEHKLVESGATLRFIDIRVNKRRALVNGDGFPINIVLQGNNSNELIKYGGIVLEQEYGGGYTGRVSHIDPVSLLEGILELDKWGLAITDAGYAKAAASQANVVHMNNRYAFEDELKFAFPASI